jgi:CHAD domain-containing protein
MTSPAREFVLDHAACAVPQLLLTATRSANGSSPASWSGGRPARSIRRTWLDTFDWRLYRAGLTLEQVGSGSDARLVLTGRDGAVLADEPLTRLDAPSWPALVGALPAGPLRERVERVAGVRALCPVARAVSKVTELGALNGDQKTVARLAVDQMSVTFPARATAPPRLTLTPVRGYQAQAERVGRALGNLPGISACQDSALVAALAAAGHRAGERPGKARGAVLQPSEPAATAMAAILASLLDALEANVAGTIRDIDTEFLHDLRIAVRWTRSALKLCGKALPDGLVSQYRPEFRWLGELTTPPRDLDVYVLRFPAMSASLVGATAGDLAPFGEYLAAARASAHRRLVRGLRSPRFSRLVTGWRADLANVRPPRRKPAVGDLAARTIAAADRRALRTGQLITATSAPESLHDLRKRCKELRYLVEMFGSLHDPGQHWQAIRELRALQDCLGEFQDADVQQTEIRAFARQMLTDRRVPAETLLAMGEIAAGLARRQRRTRSEFDARFADFAGVASQARLLGLSRSAAA